MNRLLQSFKQCMWLAAERGGLRRGELIKKYDINSFEIDEVKDTDSAEVIAAKALRYFCVEDDRFNNFTVGIAGVTLFLETHFKGPDYLARRGLVYQGLKDVLDQGAQYDAILTWVRSWYK